MDATGFFGDQTERAVAAWQKAEKAAEGSKLWNWECRAKYARRRGLPLPGKLDRNPRGPNGESKTCIDVCSELNGAQDCETRCIIDTRDRPHACQEACQIAFSAACDRAFPSTSARGEKSYQQCLSRMQDSCRATCKEYER